MAKVKGVKSPTPSYTATQVVKVRQKKTGAWIRRFNLTIAWGDERAVTLKGCIVGVSTNGPYAFKGSIYHDVVWSKSVQDDILRGFQEAGLLEDLGATNVFGPDAGPALEWSSQ